MTKVYLTKEISRKTDLSPSFFQELAAFENMQNQVKINAESKFIKVKFSFENLFKTYNIT